MAFAEREAEYTGRCLFAKQLLGLFIFNQERLGRRERSKAPEQVSQAGEAGGLPFAATLPVLLATLTKPTSG